MPRVPSRTNDENDLTMHRLVFVPSATIGEWKHRAYGRSHSPVSIMFASLARCFWLGSTMKKVSVALRLSLLNSCC